MNRYPYCQELSITSIGLSPKGEHVYELRTVRFSEWQGTVRMTRPRWKVALPQPLDAYEGYEGYSALYEGTPEKFKYTCSLAGWPRLP